MIKMKTRKPSKIQVFKNRAMVYLGKNRDKFVICSVEDIDKIKDFAWHPSGNGYAKCKMTGRSSIYFHRIIVGATERQQVVDHINRKKWDNRRENLRITTSSLNKHNSSAQPNAGVSFNKFENKWASYIGHNGKDIKLGHFKKREDAVSARLKAEIEILGFLKPRTADDRF